MIGFLPSCLLEPARLGWRLHPGERDMRGMFRRYVQAAARALPSVRFACGLP
jgi:hypothetical protein